MELAAEDALRLNVLLASGPQAIRIDESAMVIYGLTARGEASVRLNPTRNDDQYLRAVRETISGHVLGSPGGYPVYLKRWTRMGQAREQSLDQLLLLGEPEAVVAVVHAPGLTAEHARRAWWAMPCAENARRMLEKAAVVNSPIGRELADFLIEFLPFEEEPQDMIESVSLVLQPPLLDADGRRALWDKGRVKSAYYLGFLRTLPDALPDPGPAHPAHAEWQPVLGPLAESGNRHARMLLKVLAPMGQAYLQLVLQVMKKPANQDVVSVLLDTLADYFADLGYRDAPGAELPRILEDSRALCAGEDTDWRPCPAELVELLDTAPALRREAEVMLTLARLGFPVLRPVFAQSTAIGSLMRRKLEPIFTPLTAEIGCLLG